MPLQFLILLAFAFLAMALFAAGTIFEKLRAMLGGEPAIVWIVAGGVTIVMGGVLTYVVAGIERVQSLNRSALELSRGDLSRPLVSKGHRTFALVHVQDEIDELSTAVSPQTAAELTGMMELVVQGGTGTAAQIPGISVAGKTGTAETGRPGANDTWFICFAPADAPQVAVAVALSDQAGTGGASAAPIARTIMEAVLR